MTRDDLIEELDRIAEEATATVRKLTSGEAKSGVAGLQKIAHRASDAARHARAAGEGEAA